MIRIVCVLALLVSTTQSALRGQTLARPGWAGSGLSVQRWWRNAVLFEVAATPASGATGTQSTLGRLLTQLDDLQTLGADAVLLRGADAGAAGEGGRLLPAFGSLDEFDALVREASRRRVRVLIALPSGLEGEALTSAARFWLSRGASGVDFGAAPAEARAARVRALRAVMRGYVGERVVLAEASAGDAGPGGATAQSEAAEAGRRGGGDAPDMTLVPLRGFGAGTVDAAALRASLEGSGRASGSGVAVVEIDPAAPAVTGEAARAEAAALLIAKGGVAIRLSDVGEGPGQQAADAEDALKAKETALETPPPGMSPAGVSNAKRALARERAALETAPPRTGDALFRWYQRLIGMHRGNGTMLEGQQSFVNADAAGALVSVWRGRTGQVLTAVINLRAQPTQVALGEEFAKMHLRGSFLRTVVRTDTGMGAMPLSSVALPGWAVYLGELGR